MLSIVNTRMSSIYWGPPESLPKYNIPPEGSTSLEGLLKDLALGEIQKIFFGKYCIHLFLKDLQIVVSPLKTSRPLAM